jgi:hypothetical protein
VPSPEGSEGMTVARGLGAGEGMIGIQCQFKRRSVLIHHSGIVSGKRTI